MMTHIYLSVYSGGQIPNGFLSEKDFDEKTTVQIILLASIIDERYRVNEDWIIEDHNI